MIVRNAWRSMICHMPSLLPPFPLFFAALRSRLKPDTFVRHVLDRVDDQSREEGRLAVLGGGEVDGHEIGPLLAEDGPPEQQRGRVDGRDQGRVRDGLGHGALLALAVAARRARLDAGDLDDALGLGHALRAAVVEALEIEAAHGATGVLGRDLAWEPVVVADGVVLGRGRDQEAALPLDEEAVEEEPLVRDRHLRARGVGVDDVIELGRVSYGDGQAGLSGIVGQELGGW